MDERKECGNCIRWDYIGSTFSRPDGRVKDGWCRPHQKETNQSFDCDLFYSKRKQNDDYMASLKRADK